MQVESAEVKKTNKQTKTRKGKQLIEYAIKAAILCTTGI